MIKDEQEIWLKTCLSENKQSEYGTKYSFDTIDSVSKYQQNVPLCTYEDIEPYLHKIVQGAKDVLFADLPVAFERTGGSTGGKKLIPYTKKSFEDFQKAILPWFMNTAQTYGLSGKNMYLAISPALTKEETSTAGVRIGVRDEEYLGEAFFDAEDSVVVPDWVGELQDVAIWQICTLYWLLRSKELELISVWSPTFLLMLLDALESKQNELTELFTKGGEVSGHLLEADKEALVRLEAYRIKKDTACLWPNLKLISCWADASSQPFFESLKAKFLHVEFQVKGLISTESVVTVPNGEGEPSLAVQSAFFEFLTSEKSVLLAHELTVGESYEVVITTNGGLYRYVSGDMVLCKKCAEDEVILAFQGRSGVTSDLVGEKLTEMFVSGSLNFINIPYMLLTAESGYVLLLENFLDVDEKELIEKADENLSLNPQYKYARRLGQLTEIKLLHVKNLSSLYLQYKAHKGPRIGDVKVPVLCSDADFYALIGKEVS